MSVFSSTLQVVFITGGASGIGAQCARRFAAEGHKVVIGDINEELGVRLAEELTASGDDDVIFAKCNVTDLSSLEEAVDKAVSRFGRLDIAVNCAGITGGKLQRIVDLPEVEFDKVHAIDTRGMFLSLKAELKVMLQQEPYSNSPRASRGVIVNVASRAGLEGVPTFGAYCTAKHGTVGLTKVVALEHAEDRIRINAIAPGLIKTPGHTSDPTHKDLDAKLAANVPMKRWADPEECADAIYFLASEASSFMTGAVLEVDGGMAAKSR